MKVVEKGFPKCPICGEEVLVPLSSVYATGAPGPAEKTFAYWICLRCGFYFGTGGTAGYNIPKDINVGIIPEIVKFIEELKNAPTQRRFFKPK